MSGIPSRKRLHTGIKNAKTIHTVLAISVFEGIKHMLNNLIFTILITHHQDVFGIVELFHHAHVYKRKLCQHLDISLLYQGNCTMYTLGTIENVKDGSK